MKFRVCSASIMGALLSAVSVFALASGEQASNTDPVLAPASAAPQAALEEIVITAEHREESAQKAPLTIQVLNGEKLTESGLSSVTALSNLTTGVEIGVGGSSTQIYIRGVGDFSINPLSNPGVAFNVDGVSLARPDGLGGNLYDLARIEVLKGPQGTLYGRNANGGSINVITNDPKLGQSAVDLTVEGGNFDLFHATGAVNLPIGDTAALRAAFNVVNRSGYLSDGTGDDVQQAGRVRFKWQPNSDLTVQLNTDFSHAGGRNGGYTWLPVRPGSDPWESAREPVALAYRNSMPPVGALLDTEAPPAHLDNTIWSISGQLDWNVGFATLTLIPAYRHTDVDSLAFPGFYYGQPNTVHQSSFEARLGSSTPALTWVVGSYIFNEAGHGGIHVEESPIIQDSQLNYVPETTAYAAFAQATVRLVEGLRFIAGGRYTYEHRTLSGDYLDLRPTPFGPGPGTLLESFGGSANFDGVTYKTGFEYDLAPQNLLFLTASSGFKAGGLNETVAPQNLYKPEKLDSLEFGSRNRFFEQRLQVNFGLYRWKYKDLQDQRVTFDPAGQINLIFYNEGDATISGGTLDIVTKPSRADTLSLSMEFADSHYDSFIVRVPTAVFFPGSIGCPNTEVGSNTVSSCAGYQVARVPRWTGIWNYEHSFDLANAGSISLSGAAKFATSRWLATDFIPAERAAGYVTLDANLTYHSASDRYSVGAFIRNIADRAYYTGGIEQPFVPGLFAANIAPPRTFGLTVTFHAGGT